MGFHLEYDGENGKRIRSGTSETLADARLQFDRLLQDAPHLTNAEIYAGKFSVGFGEGTHVASRANGQSEWITTSS